MQRWLSLCLWQVLFVGMVSMPVYAFQETGIQIRGPKSTDPFPYGRYGPITGQDTLWGIATQVRPDPGLSIYQVMQALYRANPQAFAENNINHLVEGQLLSIPAYDEMARINKSAAQQLVEQAIQAWSKSSQKPDEQAVKKKDLEAAKSEINDQLQTYGDSQQQKLKVIQRDVADSIDGLQAILKENEELRAKLAVFNEQLVLMQQEVAKSEEIKPQMDDILKLQQEMYALAAERDRLAQAEAERKSSLNNYLLIALGSTVPATLLLGGAYLFLKRRKAEPAEAGEKPAKAKKAKAAETEEAQPEAAAAAEEPAQELTLDNELSLDDELSIDLAESDDDLFADDLDDLGSDELLDDDVIHLDDELDDLDDLDDLEDISLDLDSGESAEEVEFSDDEGELLEGGELGQGDLDDLLSGLDEDESAEEENSEALPSGELDQGDLDDLLSGLDEGESAEEEKPEELPGGELGQGDLDALLSGGDSDDEIEEVAEEQAGAEASEEVTDPDDIDALLEAADKDTVVSDPDDIDALLEAAAEPEPAAPVPEAAKEIPEGADVTDPDDIDALLEAAAPAPEAAKEIPEGADVTDPDDIDALLEAAAPAPEAVKEIPEGADVTDPDDIDALLEAAAPAPEAVKEIPEGADVTDPDDIDALLEAAAPAPEAAKEIPEGADVTDPDDIDALLEAAAPAPEAAKEIPEGADVTDPDDIDALLEAAAPAPEAAKEIPEGADVTDPDDIDALLEAAAPAPEAAAAADVEVTDPDDIDALLGDIQNQGNDEVNIDDVLQDVAADSQLEEAEEQDLAATDAETRAKIESFTEEYVAPFLSMDFSDITGKKDTEAGVEETGQESSQADDSENLPQAEVADELTEPDVQDDSLTSELDLDAILQDVESEPSITEDDLDIGDDILDEDISDELLDEIAQSEGGDELSAAFENELDEAALSQLLSEDDGAEGETLADKSVEKLDEITPDFTDENILADLLSDEPDPKKQVAEASEIDDIKELNNLDFDELLANIEEESALSPDVPDLAEELTGAAGDEQGDEILTDDLGDELDIGDDLDIGDELELPPQSQEEENAAEQPADAGEDFVSVDSLLSQTQEEVSDEEPYEKTNIDVGFDEFPEFAAEGDGVDVDDESNAITAKLDLAKVYIEIGDMENAQVILQDVLSDGDDQQKQAAEELLKDLN
ncbi:hypothetical protein SG34_019610 [Thalassomonas viridans]|uniref:Pilus assembly protein FimV n=1 Tax=Thalassomonas viridans TaxID=137584 RepID=A0AAE9YYI6_9GAMM|nr:FimV/HubP family polar landmark protein [Thalassomonas viridans]WDE03576.1 hypothetical protein SG34_019610 [Thalassomonas viridans]